jgi:CBS domain containing-hemolysin-like protein
VIIGDLVFTLVLVLVNGFFVGIEFALVGSRRSRLEELAAGGNRRARSALEATSELNLQLAGAQLGITVASLGIGAVGEPAVAHLIESVLEPWVPLPSGVIHTFGFIVGLAIVVFLHMVVGEVVPKNLALAGPERSLLWMAPISRVYLRITGPLLWLLNSLANAGVRALKVEPRDELHTAHTASELAVMVAESHEEGLIEEFAHDLLAGVLDFGDRNVSSVMVPREQVVTVARGDTVNEVEQVVVRSGHSRLPVVDPDVDAVLGFVHAKDLLTLPEEDHDQPLPLRMVRRMLVVTRDRSLEDLLLAMRRARIHFAVVVDEERRTAGVVTLEDLLEELVGDIMDETDQNEAPVRNEPIKALPAE